VTGEGWAAIPNWMVRDPEIKPNTLAVYAVIQSHAGSRGTTALRHRTIAAEAGVSLDTVKRTVKVLNELGVLWWEGTSNGSGHGANVYHPLQEKRADVVGENHSPHAPRTTSAPTLSAGRATKSPVSAPTSPPVSAGSSGSPGSGGGKTMTTSAPTSQGKSGVGAHSTQVGAVSTTKEEEPFKKNNPPTPQRSARSDDMGFSDFWARYPPSEWKSKTNKTNLRGAWFALTDEQRALTMVALAAYLGSEMWTDPKAITGPKQFLENEPWLEAENDNLPQPKPDPFAGIDFSSQRLGDDDD